LKYILESGENPMDLGVVLRSHKPNNILKTVVYNADTKDRLLERTDVFSGDKKVILKLPITSRKIIVETFSLANGKLPLGQDQSFEVSRPVIMPLKTWNVELGSGDKEFMDFIKQFAVELPRLKPDGKKRISPSGRFKIVLFDKLKSYSGDYLPTPAMIGKRTGTIEVSKDYMLQMTVSQRIATLSHEYGHYYKNPIMNLPIGDEVGADLNGMTVYLGNGFSMSEYINAFKTVFNGAKTDLNRKRYDYMKKFARKIYNGQYFGVPYNV
jgi:hypothetical protein